jgi:alpha-beta hydrolase superfamily lysophospholipase
MTKKVFFRNKKGLKLVGLLDHISFDKVVVALHGLASDKDFNGKRKKVSKILCKLGYSFFSFDFAGCGESQGSMLETSVKSRVQDYRAVIKFLKGKGYKSFAVIGASMGAAVAISAWTKSVKALVLLVPLTQPRSIHRTISRPKKLLEFIEEKILESKHVPFFLKEIETLELDEKIGKITSPTLVVQAKQDFLIRRKDTRKSYRLLNCKKKYLEVTGSHLLVLPSSFNHVLDETVKWIEKWM